MAFNAQRAVRARHHAAQTGGRLAKLAKDTEIDIVMHGADRTFMAVARIVAGSAPVTVLDLKHQSYDALEAHLRHQGFTNILGARCAFPLDLPPYLKEELAAKA